MRNAKMVGQQDIAKNNLFPIKKQLIMNLKPNLRDSRKYFHAGLK